MDLRVHLGADLLENGASDVPLGAGVADGLDEVQAAQGAEVGQGLVAGEGFLGLVGGSPQVPFGGGVQGGDGAFAEPVLLGEALQAEPDPGRRFEAALHLLRLEVVGGEAEPDPGGGITLRLPGGTDSAQGAVVLKGVEVVRAEPLLEHRWDRVPGVTLIGDAAHLSLPNGEGANLAMFDGAELADALAAHPGDTETALTEYERAVFPRSAAAAADGNRLHDLLYGDRTPHGLIDMFAGPG